MSPRRDARAGTAARPARGNQVPTGALPADVACDAGGLCAADGTRLANAPSATVQGPPALADWARGMSDHDVFGTGTGSDPWPGAGVGEGGGRRPESRELTGRDFLTGTSFAATGGTAEGGFASAWGRGAGGD